MGKIVLILNGKPRAGKDTFSELLNERIRVYKYSSIQKIKEVAKECGWNGGKTEKDRKFLSDLKILTTEYSDMPFDDIKERVQWFKSSNWIYDIMIIDIREPGEIERAVKEFGAISIFIDNKNVENITSNMADANVENYKYDYTLSNNGTLKDFEYVVGNFYYNIIKKMI
jgi:hypothetical protein